MSSTTLKSQFFSVPEAATFLGCTHGRIRQLLLAGRLRGEKLNARAWAVSKSSCREYSRSGRRPGPKAKKIFRPKSKTY